MITPVLLCGGAGTRLWPLSRRSYPKQFTDLIGGHSLFQASALRLSGWDYAPPLVVTGSDFRFIVTEQLAEVGIDTGAILIEPSGRNTAPAILAAAIHLAASDPETLMLVAPSDHVVPDAALFQRTVAAGVEAARSGQIVTFGIRPDRPETGYGWLELEGGAVDVGADVGAAGGAGASGVQSRPDQAADTGLVQPQKLRRFVEKPDADLAQSMLDQGNFLWNGGIFLFTARTILAAAEAYAPDLLAPCRAAVAEASTDLGFLRLAPAPWARAEEISIDYAVMEKADNLVVVPFQGRWSDLGDWAAVWRDIGLAGGADSSGVVRHGPSTGIDCHDSLLRSEVEGLELVGIGLSNIIAVAMPDAVLVADRSRAQDVKLAVAALKKRNARQAETFPLDHRPWGWFETLAISARFQVKRIVVNPGASLSLQSHMHRSEHWIVVAGTAKVTIDGEQRLITENQSVYIPLGALHRMENPGLVPMILIEVQTGAYLGEDDIIRYEDIYARGQGAKG